MTDQPDELRAFTRRLFTDPDAPPQEAPPADEPARGNVAPKEGTGTTPGDSSGGNLRAFTRRLFGREDW
jgi:hypothetical protein